MHWLFLKLVEAELSFIVNDEIADMFPRTGHVETIIMMTNCGKDKIRGA
jgi:hypothetical protein